MGHHRVVGVGGSGHRVGHRQTQWRPALKDRRQVAFHGTLEPVLAQCAWLFCRRLTNLESGSMVRASNSRRNSSVSRRVELETCSAKEYPESTRQEDRIPKRTKGCFVDQSGVVVRALSAAFSWQWKRQTLPFGCDGRLWLCKLQRPKVCCTQPTQSVG